MENPIDNKPIKVINWPIKRASLTQQDKVILAKLLTREYFETNRYLSLYQWRHRQRLEAAMLIYITHIRCIMTVTGFSCEKLLGSHKWTASLLPLIWQNISKFYKLGHFDFGKLLDYIPAVQKDYQSIFAEPIDSRVFYLLKKGLVK